MRSEAEERYERNERTKEVRKAWARSPEGKRSQAQRMERYWRKRLHVEDAIRYCEQVVLVDTPASARSDGASTSRAYGAVSTARAVLALLSAEPT